MNLAIFTLSADLFDRLGFDPSNSGGGQPDIPPDNGDTGEDVDFQVRALSDTSAIYSFKFLPQWPTQGPFYVCQDEENECYPGTIKDGRIEYTHVNLQLGREYTALLKVPGMSTAEFPRYQFMWNGNGAGLLSSLNAAPQTGRLLDVINPCDI